MYNIIKTYLKALCILLIINVVIREHNDQRPFIFEKYTTGESLREALQKTFPVGSDGEKAITILVNSGVCKMFSNRICEDGACTPFEKHGLGATSNDRYSIDLTYYSPFFSLNPYALYEVSMLLDQDRKITHIIGGRWGILDGMRY